MYKKKSDTRASCCFANCPQQEKKTASIATTFLTFQASSTAESVRRKVSFRLSRFAFNYFYTHVLSLCVLSLLSIVQLLFIYLFLFLFVLLPFLLNAVNFPGTAIPFSISFKGKFNKRHPRLSAFFRISTHPFGYNLK